VVRIVFVIDACDREIIAWSAVANAGISGEIVCDLMIAAVERRFQALKVPHRLERLSDNGSAYIARQTAQMAAALGIDLLFTPDAETILTLLDLVMSNVRNCVTLYEPEETTLMGAKRRPLAKSSIGCSTLRCIATASR
jgi:transposase InsO family protein